MKLATLFRQLAFGELKNLSMAAGGAIATANQPEIVIHANEGLLRLYSHFVLKEKSLLLEMVDGVTNYHLTKQFAESTWIKAQQGDGVDDAQPTPEWAPTPYIKDLLGEPFEEDVLKILAVYDGHIYGAAYGGGWQSPYTGEDNVYQYGTIQDTWYPWLQAIRGDNLSNSLPLNDSEDLFSLFTPQANVLQVPHPKPGRALGIHYQASHPRLNDSEINTEAWIELPEVLVGALKAFIAHKVFGYMNGQDNQIASDRHLNNFKSICGDVEDKDLVSNSQSTTNIRFSKRGWV